MVVEGGGSFGCGCSSSISSSSGSCSSSVSGRGGSRLVEMVVGIVVARSVSYTHLTLPTN